MLYALEPSAGLLAGARAEGANLVGDAGPGRPAVLRAADESRFAERRERPALGV